MSILPESFVKLFNTTPPDFPCTLKADIAMRIGFPAFAAFGILGAYFSLKIHSYFALTIMTATILILLVLSIGLYSYRLTVDDEGLHFSWIMGKRTAKWTDMVRLERAKNTFSLYNKNGDEVVPLSVLPYNTQKVIADKALEMVKFKHDDKKQKYPVLEQWTR